MIIHHNCKKCGSLHIYSKPISVYRCNSCSYFNQIEDGEKDARCNHYYKIVHTSFARGSMSAKGVIVACCTKCLDVQKRILK